MTEPETQRARRSERDGASGERDSNTAFARALVDEWARAGLEQATLAPGSRSAPLALALAAEPRITLHVHLDERSAAFFALGAARASGRPALVLSTSGTAAANLHPAVLEAREGRVPVLVCTADRPPELRHTGAGQVVDQVKLYGTAVRFFVEVGVPRDHPDAPRYWRSLAARAWAEALGPPAGPVHLNLAFAEPLVPTGAELPPAPGRPAGRPWVVSAPAPRLPAAADVERLAGAVAGSQRGLLVAGGGAGDDPGPLLRFARAAGWPVLADPLSGARSGPLAVSTYEALLRVPGFAEAHRPDLVVRVGAALTSKAATAWLDDSIHQVLVDPDGAWADPGRAAAERVAADPGILLGAVADRLGVGRAPSPGLLLGAVADRLGVGRAPSPWLAGWLEAEAVARRALDAHLDADDELFEGRVARDLAACLPGGSTLVVASSMPVRDLEAFAAPREGLRVLANRGANGIDGFTSTVLGVAAVSSGPVAALAGDLCFLHDAAGLTGAAGRGLDAVLVVVDNDGGGIFSFLPQAALPAFETLFGTPHGLDLVALAGAYGLPAERLAKAGELAPAVEAALAAGGVRVVVVPTGDRAANVNRHRLCWEAVAVEFGGIGQD